MFFIFSAKVLEFECDKLLDDITATKKETALCLALSRLASDFGRESMLSLQQFFSSRHAPVISTGSLKLDIALGVWRITKGDYSKDKNFLLPHISYEHMHTYTPHIYARDTGRFLVHYTKRDVWDICV